MLGKLMKHEFRATRRVMLPLYLILLVTAVAANFSTRMLFDSRHWVLTTLGTLLVISFGVAVAGVCVMPVLLMVQRFYKNLLQDEGYIMLTLPASIHQHVWAKLIVSAAWFVVTVVVVIAAGCVMAFDIGVIRDFFEGSPVGTPETRGVLRLQRRRVSGGTGGSRFLRPCGHVPAVLCRLGHRPQRRQP